MSIEQCPENQPSCPGPENCQSNGCPYRYREYRDDEYCADTETGKVK